jgi:hypothetical protein
MTATATIPTPKQVFKDAATFARTFLRILDKEGRIVPLRYNRAQRHYLAHRTPRDLILKARQHGFSTVVQAEFFRLETTSTQVSTTLAHDDDTTQKLRRMATRFYDNLPDNFRPLRGANNARLTTYPDFGSEALIATAGNVHTGRGGTNTLIHGSEVAYWKDGQAIGAGLLQAGTPHWVVWESTPNGAQGYFYNLCMEALDGASGWTLHFYPWWWADDYRLPLEEGEVIEYTDEEALLVEANHLAPEQIKWRRAKQRELKHQFIQEYVEDPRSCFLRSGLGYFGDLAGVFTAPLNPAYDETHRYVAGLDFGQTTDYTACSVIDASARVEVARLRINRLPWQEMRRQVIDLCRKWHVSVIQAEKNSMGSTNIEAMLTEMEEKGNDGLPRCEASLIAFETTNESKASIMSALHEGLHSPTGLRLQADDIWTHELKAFIATQLPSGAWRLSAPDADGEHDDTVIARALAWDQVVNYRPNGGIWG